MGNRTSLQKEEIKAIGEETGFTPYQIEALYRRFVRLDKGSNGSLSREDFLSVPELAINPLSERIVHMFFADCDDDHERINFRQFMKVLSTFKPFKSKDEFKSPPNNLMRKSSMQSNAIYRKNSTSNQDLDYFNIRKHIRHSSLDGFLNNFRYSCHDISSIEGHFTTNQHSMHYASASNLYTKQDRQGSQSYLDLYDEDPPNSPRRLLYFMFKIYDVDNDDVISFNDLYSSLKMMVGNYINDTKIRWLVKRVLAKADKDHDGSLNFQEFSSVFLGKDLRNIFKVKFPKSD